MKNCFLKSKAIKNEEASSYSRKKSSTFVKIGWTSNSFRIFAFYWKEKKKKPWREEKEKIETRQEIFLRNQICTWRGKDMKREIDDLSAEPNLRNSDIQQSRKKSESTEICVVAHVQAWVCIIFGDDLFNYEVESLRTTS